MRGLRTSGAETNRLVLESRPLFFYQRAVIDKGLGTVRYSAGVRVPFLGEVETASGECALDGLEHLRIFAYFDLQHADGTHANAVRYGVVVEGPVDESRLDQLHMPGKDGMLIAMPKTLLEAQEVADEVSRFLGLRVLVPARFRRAAGVR